MPSDSDQSEGPSFVVLRKEPSGDWRVIGQVRRQPGLTARAARARAVQVASEGQAQPDEVYAAVLSSEWRVAQDL